MALWCNHRVQEQGNFGTRKLKEKIVNVRDFFKTEKLSRNI